MSPCDASLILHSRVERSFLCGLDSAWYYIVLLQHGIWLSLFISDCLIANTASHQEWGPFCTPFYVPKAHPCAWQVLEPLLNG